MSGGGAEAGVKGGQAVVGTVQLGIGGDADVGSGGRTDGGGGRIQMGWILRRIKLVGKILQKTLS